MAKLGFVVDPTKANLSQGGQGLPVGLKIPCELKEIRIERTQDKLGGKLVFVVSIFDGPYKGRTGIIPLNVKNKSEKAVEIAHDHLARIGVCVGITAPIENTDQFKIGAKFLIDTEPKELENSGAIVGEFKRVFSLNGSAPAEVINLIRAGKFKDAIKYNPAQFADEWAVKINAPNNKQEEAGGWGGDASAPTAATAPSKPAKPGKPAAAPDKPAQTEPEDPWGDLEAEAQTEEAPEEAEEAPGDEVDWG